MRRQVEEARSLINTTALIFSGTTERLGFGKKLLGVASVHSADLFWVHRAPARSFQEIRLIAVFLLNREQPDRGGTAHTHCVCAMAGVPCRLAEDFAEVGW